MLSVVATAALPWTEEAGALLTRTKAQLEGMRMVAVVEAVAAIKVEASTTGLGEKPVLAAELAPAPAPALVGVEMHRRRRRRRPNQGTPKGGIGMPRLHRLHRSQS